MSRYHSPPEATSSTAPIQSRPSPSPGQPSSLWGAFSDRVLSGDLLPWPRSDPCMLHRAAADACRAVAGICSRWTVRAAVPGACLDEAHVVVACLARVGDATEDCKSGKFLSTVLTGIYLAENVRSQDYALPTLVNRFVIFGSSRVDTAIKRPARVTSTRRKARDAPTEASQELQLPNLSNIFHDLQ